jgi:hypothetical protein
MRMTPDWNRTGRAAVAMTLALCGCDEWLATKRDDSPPPRLASADSLDRPARPETLSSPSSRSERPPSQQAPSSATAGTPSASLSRPSMPPPVALPSTPSTAKPATPAQAAQKPFAAPPPATAPSALAPQAPMAPHSFPAAPRFPAAPQPAQQGGEPAGNFPGRMPPGARPMMPHMNNMRIARPPPTQE